MNVMAQAHKNTKLFFQVQPLSSFTYAQVFRDYLKQSHKEYKAMMTKEVALALLQADSIAQFEKRIAELKAVKETPLAEKWIVTCGNLPVDFDAPNQAWPWANVETCSTWNSPQFARAYAQKIRNGKGQFGEAILMADHIDLNIANLKDLIQGIHSAS